MAAGKDKPDEGAAGPETSLAPINKGRAWEVLERQGLNTPRDNPVDDYQRAQDKAAVAQLLNEPDSAQRVASASATAVLHEECDPELLERLRLIFDAEEERQDAFMRALLGELPDWVHSETWRQLSVAYCDLSEQGFTDAQILDFAAREEENFVPGRAPNSIAFLRAVNYLAHVRYAVSLGPEEGLEVLYGPDASRGYRSHEGSKQLRGERWYTAPLRDFVADMASRCASQPPTLPQWEAAAREFCDAQLWTEDGVEIYLGDVEHEETGEQKTVVVAQLPGKSGETLKTKTLTLRQIYAHFPKFPA